MRVKFFHLEADFSFYSVFSFSNENFLFFFKQPVLITADIVPFHFILFFFIYKFFYSFFSSVCFFFFSFFFLITFFQIVLFFFNNSLILDFYFYISFIAVIILNTNCAEIIKTTTFFSFSFCFFPFISSFSSFYIFLWNFFVINHIYVTFFFVLLFLFFFVFFIPVIHQFSWIHFHFIISITETGVNAFLTCKKN